MTDQNNPTLFRFLELPRELREYIYELTFASHKVELELTTDGADPITSRNAGLPLTCKQLHNESIKVYYEYPTFNTDSGFSLCVWLSLIRPDFRSLVEDICIVKRLPDVPRATEWIAESLKAWNLEYINGMLEEQGLELRQGTLRVEMVQVLMREEDDFVEI